MSMGEYYGRVDYTSQRPDDKNLFSSIIELLQSVVESISKIFTKTVKR